MRNDVARSGSQQRRSLKGESVANRVYICYQQPVISRDVVEDAKLIRICCGRQSWKTFESL